MDGLAVRMESRSSKSAEDNVQLDDDELRRNAHPWMAKRTENHGAYATARTCDRHSPPGVFLPTTLVVCAFRSYRRQGISKLRLQADDSYQRPTPSWAA